MTPPAPPQPSHPGQKLSDVMRPWRPWFPLLVLGVVLSFSLVAAALVSRLIYGQQQARFNREISAHTSALTGRIQTFGHLLQASRAFWVSQSVPPTPATFRAFTSGLELETRYPDVQALGFVRWGEKQALPSLSVTSASQPVNTYPVSTEQPYRAVIQFIAPPNETNVKALGFDMYSESHRRQAIESARLHGDLRITDPVPLVQKDASGQPKRGFLVFLPVRRSAGPVVSTLEAGTLEGFIYLAIEAQSFIKSLDASYGRDLLASRITLGGQPLGDGAPLANGKLQKPMQLAGQTWQVTYAPPRSFASEPLNWLSPLIALLGFLASGVAFDLLRRQTQALEFAEAANHDLTTLQQRQQRARAEFEAIFQAMQDAAAFTDEQGRVRLVNRAMTEQFRTPMSELVGHPLTLLHLDRRLDDRSIFQALTTPYQRSDGSRFYGEAQRNEVKDAHGELLGHLEVIRDVSERVSADQALRDEERRSRAILDAIPHMVWVSHPAGNVTYVNTQYDQRLRDLQVPQQMEPQDREIYANMWQSAYIESRSAHCTVRIRVLTEDTEETQLRWFEVRVAPLLDEEGQAVEWVASATDIHDRLLAEQSAQNSEARYRGVVEGMPQIVWLADREGQTTYFNQRWEEYVGDEAGRALLPTLHPDDRDDYRARWEAALRGGHPFEAEHRLRHHSGEYRNFVTRGLPIRGPDGEVLEWVGTMTDVDDSVYAENAARLLVDVTEAMMMTRPAASSGLSVQRYDAVLRLLISRLMEAASLWVTMPEEWEAQAEIDPDAVPTELPKLQPLVAAADNPNWDLPHISQMIEQLAQYAALTREPKYLMAHPLLHAVEASGGVLYPLIGADGVLRGVLGLAHRHPLHDRDHELIAELASRLTTALETDALRERADNAQQELRQLNQSLEERVQRRTLELEEANRELEAFSYSVSHDLRTPLRHIVGFGDLLRKEMQSTITPKGERYLGVMTEAAGRMSGLIDSLLEFSRMGRQPLRAVPVELGPLVERVWHTLEPDRQGREVHLELHALPTVQADPALLELVFQNLLSNAIKYSRTREVAQVEVAGVVSGGMVQVSVRDNGVGFDPKYTDKLFGVFQRLHRAEDFDGIGIGLANVRRIVLRHGGQVSGASVPGEGATFTVSLPLHPEKDS
ncbi:PAS domain S-box protein [Deinococcus sp.]|uniref:PAS domain S-box protein n=1 Tax=Deinococcus sp. TaxID=47478 RepID=UPI0034C6B834